MTPQIRKIHANYAKFILFLCFIFTSAWCYEKPQQKQKIECSSIGPNDSIVIEHGNILIKHLKK